MYVAIKKKEKLKNNKYSKRCQMIDSDFMPKAFEIYGAESCSLFCVAELLEGTFFSYSSNF